MDRSRYRRSNSRPTPDTDARRVPCREPRRAGGPPSRSARASSFHGRHIDENGEAGRTSGLPRPSGTSATGGRAPAAADRPAIGRSEEHTSELQSLMRSAYAGFCLKKKNKEKTNTQKSEQIVNTQKQNYKVSQYSNYQHNYADNKNNDTDK